ncbi:unnamed protein product [Pseudo-nitzschia multistriata]|uniref:Sm domain-containing protein n=1 Tax=Pseudo-nitzschia multistriata TaxID=183589 RepID=A0A448ZEG3_9STRA|nr:unnamed protein product [Pseudo-nitzschia multistriata]
MAAVPDAEAMARERRKESFEYTRVFLLGKRIKCTLTDGRTLTGTFICIDRLKNLILTDVLEERSIDPSDYKHRVGSSEPSTEPPTARCFRRVERKISQAMVPGERLVRVELLPG